MSYVKSVSGSDYRFLVRGVMLYHTCPWLNLLNGPLMFKRRYVTLLPLFVLLAACSSKPKPTETDTTTGTPSGGFLLEPQHNVMQMGGDFANNPNAQQFIDKMVNENTVSIVENKVAGNSLPGETSGFGTAADG